MAKLAPNGPPRGRRAVIVAGLLVAIGLLVAPGIDIGGHDSEDYAIDCLALERELGVAYKRALRSVKHYTRTRLGVLPKLELVQDATGVDPEKHFGVLAYYESSAHVVRCVRDAWLRLCAERQLTQSRFQSLAWATLLHELGHAVGRTHAIDLRPDVPNNFIAMCLEEGYAQFVALECARAEGLGDEWEDAFDTVLNLGVHSDATGLRRHYRLSRLEHEVVYSYYLVGLRYMESIMGAASSDREVFARTEMPVDLESMELRGDAADRSAAADATTRLRSCVLVGAPSTLWQEARELSLSRLVAEHGLHLGERGRDWIEGLRWALEILPMAPLPRGGICVQHYGFRTPQAAEDLLHWVATEDVAGRRSNGPIVVEFCGAIRSPLAHVVLRTRTSTGDFVHVRYARRGCEVLRVSSRFEDLDQARVQLNIGERVARVWDEPEAGVADAGMNVDEIVWPVPVDERELLVGESNQYFVAARGAWPISVLEGRGQPQSARFDAIGRRLVLRHVVGGILKDSGYAQFFLRKPGRPIEHLHATARAFLAEEQSNYEFGELGRYAGSFDSLELPRPAGGLEWTVLVEMGDTSGLVVDRGFGHRQVWPHPWRGPQFVHLCVQDPEDRAVAGARVTLECRRPLLDRRRRVHATTGADGTAVLGPMLSDEEARVVVSPPRGLGLAAASSRWSRSLTRTQPLAPARDVTVRLDGGRPGVTYRLRTWGGPGPRHSVACRTGTAVKWEGLPEGGISVEVVTPGGVPVPFALGDFVARLREIEAGADDIQITIFDP